MGFGSYDESEQEQPSDDDEEDGEAVTKDDSEYHGSDAIEDENVNDMLGHL